MTSSQPKHLAQGKTRTGQACEAINGQNRVLEQLGNAAFVAEAVIWLYVVGVHRRNLKINPNSEASEEAGGAL